MFPGLSRQRSVALVRSDDTPGYISDAPPLHPQLFSAPVDHESIAKAVSADVKKMPCQTCATEQYSSDDEDEGACCDGCAEYFCSSANGETDCIYEKAIKCSVDVCMNLSCSKCLAWDGRCPECDECEYCEMSNTHEKIVCAVCETRYCKSTCQCGCDVEVTSVKKDVKAVSVSAFDIKSSEKATSAMDGSIQGPRTPLPTLDTDTRILLGLYSILAANSPDSDSDSDSETEQAIPNASKKARTSE